MKLIAANWKLNNSPADSRAFFKQFLPLNLANETRVIFFPPALSLAACAEATSGTQFELGLQNACSENSGAWTGENSISMAQELGAKWVLVGHSERRSYFAETDEMLQKKMTLAVRTQAQVMFCVGETLAERDGDATMAVLKKQLNIVQNVFTPGSSVLSRLVVAYEPVWAIGTGRVATIEQISETHASLRQFLHAKYDSMIPLLYGGSVKPDNAKEIMQVPDVDGLLVGGASVKPDSFRQLLQAAGCLR